MFGFESRALSVETNFTGRESEEEQSWERQRDSGSSAPAEGYHVLFGCPVKNVRVDPLDQRGDPIESDNNTTRWGGCSSAAFVTFGQNG